MIHAPEMAYKGGGFRPDAFKEIEALESSNFWFRSRNHLILWTLNRYGSGVRSFLEIGCGTGFVLSGLSHARTDMKLCGSEIFIAGLPYARKRVPSAELMQMDARCIPFLQEFDAVGAFDVLEHIPEDEAVLTQLYQSLKPGGLLLVTVPQHPWLWSATDERACHVRRYTTTELQKKVTATGFDVLRTTSFVSLLLPAMLLSRGRKSNHSDGSRIKAGDESNLSAELQLSKLLNTALYCVMGIERFLIRLGINFKAGGSRLVVARRPSRK